MPDWFRRAAERLLAPEQCVRCGVEIGSGGYRRARFVVFCGSMCALVWDSW